MKLHSVMLLPAYLSSSRSENQYLVAGEKIKNKKLTIVNGLADGTETQGNKTAQKQISGSEV